MKDLEYAAERETRLKQELEVRPERLERGNPGPDRHCQTTAERLGVCSGEGNKTQARIRSKAKDVYKEKPPSTNM